MKITKLYKESVLVDMKNKYVNIRLDLQLDERDLKDLNYSGFDMFPDKKIPAVLLWAAAEIADKTTPDGRITSLVA